jgi:hypothetical protein
VVSAIPTGGVFLTALKRFVVPAASFVHPVPTALSAVGTSRTTFPSPGKVVWFAPLLSLIAQSSQ